MATLNKSGRLSLDPKESLVIRSILEGISTDAIYGIFSNQPDLLEPKRKGVKDVFDIISDILFVFGRSAL